MRLPLLLTLTTLFALSEPTQVAAGELELLPYNNPGLVVDLGVGLWAWPVPCDADGDGDFDLVVSCHDKPSKGVWLFENATGDTAQNKFPVLKPGKLLSTTVPYITPSYVDGKLHVLSPGFRYPDFAKTGVTDREAIPVAAGFYKPQWEYTKGPGVRHVQFKYVDYDGDGKLDLITGVEDWSEYGWDDAFDASGQWTAGVLHGFVLLHRNIGTTESPTYEPYVTLQAEGAPIDTFGCPSPNFADFDGDGDLDLLCGEFLDGFNYYENFGTRTEPHYAKVRRLQQADGSPLIMDLQMIVPVAFDWDRDGDFDLIVGDEDGRVALVENVSPESPKHGDTPRFLAPRYFQQEADTLKCGALATPCGCDFDGDGDTDIVSGNTAGYIEFFENLSGPKVAKPKWAAPKKITAGDKIFRIMAGPNGSVQGPAEAKWGYTTLSVADWDRDGLLDIVYNSILGKVEWLQNIGTKTEPKFAAPQAVEIEWPDKNVPKPQWVWKQPQGKQLVTQWRTTPVVHDFNGDGLPDLAMLDTEGYWAIFERAVRNDRLLLLPPRRSFVDAEGKPLHLNPRRAGGSGRRKLHVVDWDGDGALDLLLNSTSADFYRGLDLGSGLWRFEPQGTLSGQNIEGHDVSPTTVDFDGDGIPDFLGGAENGRFYWMRNPRSQEK
jgi:hypothetical protein